MSLTSIIAAVALIAILVFIHESGHFVVAKLCGVRVDVFSFGFGRRLFGVQIGDTDYRLSLLPFGGYVRMAGADAFGYGEGEDEEAPPVEGPDSFQRRPVWQRLIILAAGPLFNLALPLFVFTGLYMLGEPQPAAVVGTVHADTVVAEAGLLEGDRVLSVDGRATATWRDVIDALNDADADMTLEVERGGRTLTVVLPAPSKDSALPYGLSHQRLDQVAGVWDSASPAGKAGVRTGDAILAVNGQDTPSWADVARGLAASGATAELLVSGPDGRRAVTLRRDEGWRPLATGARVGPDEVWGLANGTLFIGSVGDSIKKDSTDILAGCRPAAEEPPSPARSAGLQEGDRFVSMNGKPVSSWGHVLAAVGGTMVGAGETAEAKPLDVEVARDGKLVSLQLQPQVIRDTNALGEYYYRPILGVVRLGGYDEGVQTRVYYGFGDASSMAFKETALIGGAILAQIGKLITGEAAVQKSLGGPVEMFRQAGHAAERGPFDWARLMAMLSISLGIVNFLPVPLLDGGHILFYAVEAVRGRPLSLSLRERVQQVGLLFLVLLMLSVLVFDIQRIFEGPG